MLPLVPYFLTNSYRRLYSITRSGKFLSSGLNTAAVNSLIRTDKFGSANIAASHRASDGRTKCLAARGCNDGAVAVSTPHREARVIQSSVSVKSFACTALTRKQSTKKSRDCSTTNSRDASAAGTVQYLEQQRKATHMHLSSISHTQSTKIPRQNKTGGCIP